MLAIVRLSHILPKNLLGLILILGIGSVSGQERCLTETRLKQYASPTELQEHRHAFENWLSAQRRTRARAAARSNEEIYVLPVVVHVIHAGEAVGQGTNLAQAQVESQIEVLNEDFRRLPNTPGYNTHPDGADSEIQFCLAGVDPDGNSLAEPGIHRVDAASIGLSEPPYSQVYVDNTIKPRTIWDPYRYVNIWVVELEGELALGFATFPTASGLPGVSGAATDANDGVVIDYEVFGREGSARAPYDQGRSATHEMGHFLGLRHIWGIDNSNCSSDDFCDDTPTADGPTYGCPFNEMACGGVKMIANYLDYTDDRCMSIFTQCQKTRMRTVLENSPRRKELLASSVCVLTARPPEARFTASDSAGCPGLVVRFADVSTNFPTERRWRFPGGSPETSTESAPEVRYGETGTYPVELLVGNESGEDEMIRRDFVQITPSRSLSVFYREDFELGFNDWVVQNESGAGWMWSEAVGGSRNGMGAALMPMFDYSDVGARDQLISPELDFTSRYGLSLSFDYAYRRRNTNTRDSFFVKLSTDGGESFPHLIWAASETGQGSFATQTDLATAFIPLRDDDWCYEGAVGRRCPELNLEAFDNRRTVRIMFETRNAGGNNLYIDNIELRAACLPQTETGKLAFDAAYIPGARAIGIQTDLEFGGTGVIEVVDIWGRVLYRSEIQVTPGRFNQNLPLSYIPTQMLIVRLSLPDGEGARKILVRP